VRCICGSALALATNIKHLAGCSCNLTLVGADGEPSAIPGNRTGTECADYPLFSFLNTVENTVIKAEIAHRSRVHGIWSTFDLSTSTHDTTNLRISPCPDLHLVMTFWRQLPSCGHTQSDFNGPYPSPTRSSHLAPEMLLSNALWQPVTTLPT
jgi:hypothetical protein